MGNFSHFRSHFNLATALVLLLVITIMASLVYINKQATSKEESSSRSEPSSSEPSSPEEETPNPQLPEGTIVIGNHTFLDGVVTGYNYNPENPEDYIPIASFEASSTSLNALSDQIEAAQAWLQVNTFNPADFSKEKLYFYVKLEEHPDGTPVQEDYRSGFTFKLEDTHYIYLRVFSFGNLSEEELNRLKPTYLHEIAHQVQADIYAYSGSKWKYCINPIGEGFTCSIARRIAEYSGLPYDEDSSKEYQEYFAITEKLLELHKGLYFDLLEGSAEKFQGRFVSEDGRNLYQEANEKFLDYHYNGNEKALQEGKEILFSAPYLTNG